MAAQVMTQIWAVGTTVAVDRRRSRPSCSWRSSTPSGCVRPPKSRPKASTSTSTASAPTTTDLQAWRDRGSLSSPRSRLTDVPPANATSKGRSQPLRPSFLAMRSGRLPELRPGTIAAGVVFPQHYAQNALVALCISYHSQASGAGTKCAAKSLACSDCANGSRWLGLTVRRVWLPAKQAGITRRARRFKGESNMRKIALGMAVAASAIAAPAMARDGQGYFGADIGAVIDNEVRRRHQRRSRMPSGSSTTTAGISARFSATTSDASGPRSKCPTRKAIPDTLIAGPPGIPHFNARPRLPARSIRSRGELQLVTAMANAMFDFGGNDGVGFSAGVGAGHAWVDAKYIAGRQLDGPFGGLPRRQRSRLGVAGHRRTSAFRSPMTPKSASSIAISTPSSSRCSTRSAASTGSSSPSHSALVTFIANFGGRSPASAAASAASASAASAASAAASAASAGRALQPGAVHRVLRLG